MKVFLFFTGIHAAACEAPIQNITKARSWPALAALAEPHASANSTASTAALPRQLVGAVDFAVIHWTAPVRGDGGLEDIGECIGKYEKPCENVGIHDNSSRLVLST